MAQFNKDSVVCFFGDSITANGTWIRRVYDYYRLEKKIPCRFYNCGVGGDRAEHALWRMEETVFCYEPTDVVVAFGMNDCGYTIYGQNPLTDKGVLDRRRLLDTCISNLRRIVMKSASRGVRVTFCTPTLPDELSEGPTQIYYGAGAALMELSLRIRTLAEEFGLDVVDFHFPFRQMQLKLFREGQTMVCPDRIHPVAEGHELMARLFLQAQGFDVALPDSWEQLQSLAQVPHDEWENRRYQLETEANCNMYVEWDFGFGKKSKEAMENAVAAQLQVEEREYIRGRLEHYLESRDQLPVRRQALIDHTNTVLED